MEKLRKSAVACLPRAEQRGSSSKAVRTCCCSGRPGCHASGGDSWRSPFGRRGPSEGAFRYRVGERLLALGAARDVYCYQGGCALGRCPEAGRGEIVTCRKA